jgi:hypothetical protein
VNPTASQNVALTHETPSSEKLNSGDTGGVDVVQLLPFHCWINGYPFAPA